MVAGAALGLCVLYAVQQWIAAHVLQSDFQSDAPNGWILLEAALCLLGAIFLVVRRERGRIGAVALSAVVTTFAIAVAMFELNGPPVIFVGALTVALALAVVALSMRVMDRLGARLPV